jgi:hypothetical protein
LRDGHLVAENQNDKAERRLFCESRDDEKQERIQEVLSLLWRSDPLLFLFEIKLERRQQENTEQRVGHPADPAYGFSMDRMDCENERADHGNELSA